ncbi:hypothetical protein AALP_AA6G148100 [Arabis alpina]|uniref:Auxin-responsive protein n=1 Tax=Arabis alpina TaxID=50452 RepID=A0A087GPA1_ARAAL|nr:hypothetical protein AALP_AA6G148100 [Arabis alpina]
MELNLCLGLPGGGETTATVAGNKRGYSETVDLKLNLNNEPETNKEGSLVSKENTSSICPKDSTKPPPAKAQVVGWPPVRSYRKNVMSATAEATFVKVSMDGAPYLRKIDLKMYKSYNDLSNALTTMFSSFTMSNNKGGEGMIDFMKERKIMDGSEYVPSYEDKDGDWMLVGDVPWEMFVESCKRIRIMKGSEAIGLAPRAMEKCESRV